MPSDTWKKGRSNRGGGKRRFGKLLSCLCSGEHLQATDGMVPSLDALATKDCTASVCTTQADEPEQKLDISNIEEAESSLRESGGLNYEEARALLGRYEYQKGNLEAALHVFDGIDLNGVCPKIKLSLSKKVQRTKRHSQTDANPPLSIHAVSLLLEAIYLKSKSLQALGRFKDAAQTCKVILDTIESSLPEGLPENFGADCKLLETVNRAVELLPELWKLADSPHEVIISYRRGLLYHWNVDAETTARIQKEFAIFLLYCGGETSPPNLLSQMYTSFVPRNNIEEAILLLMILLRKVSLKRIERDPSILDHLSFALSVSGDLRSLANQVEELFPGIMERKEMYETLALCYYGCGEGQTALNLLRKLLHSGEDSKCILALLLAAKICGEAKLPNLSEEGIIFSRRALQSWGSRCDGLAGAANCFLGISLSEHSKTVASDCDRVREQTEALKALETAVEMTKMMDPRVVYHFSLENAEQRKLDIALHYAKYLLKLEGGSNNKGWILLARILSAQKRYTDAETIVNAALDETGKWDQGNLLQTKAKLQIAQRQMKKAVQTYTQLLALLQVQNKSFGSDKKSLQGSRDINRCLEVETWHDLAQIYISTSQWRDAEFCLSRSKAIDSYSASGCYATALLHEAKGLHKEALVAYVTALNVDPNHVPSLVSMAVIMRQLGIQPKEIIRNFLTEALRLDRMNHSAWYNLGKLYKDMGPASFQEAAECFEAAVLLEESAPVEPFR